MYILEQNKCNPKYLLCCDRRKANTICLGFFVVFNTVFGGSCMDCVPFTDNCEYK